MYHDCNINNDNNIALKTFNNESNIINHYFIIHYTLSTHRLRLNRVRPTYLMCSNGV